MSAHRRSSVAGRGQAQRGAFLQRQPLGPRRVLPEQRAAAYLQRAHRLLEGGLEAAVDGHDLAGGLHLGADAAFAEGELVEGPARYLHHHVVQGRLEGGGGLLGDGVGDLVQALADGDLRRHAGDGIAGRLAGQGRAAGHARVHLDDVVRRGRGVLVLPGGDLRPRRQGELDVAAALDAQGADDAQAGRAQHLVLLVGEGLAGRDHDAVAGVDAHGVEVLHVADGDAVVGAVAHHLVLDFLPAQQAALQQHLVDGAGGQPAGHDALHVVLGVGDAAAGAAQGVGGAHHQGQAQPAGHLSRLVHGGDGGALRHRLADVGQHALEELAVLGLADGVQRRAQEAHAVAVEDAGVGQVHGQVEAGLAAQRGQEAVGPLALDDAGDDVDGEGLDVDDVGDALVGHDGGGVGVDEDGGDALLAHGLAGLRAGVVELRRLADDDRPGADDEDLLRFAHSLALTGASPVLSSCAAAAPSAGRGRRRRLSRRPGPAPGGWRPRPAAASGR